MEPWFITLAIGAIIWAVYRYFIKENEYKTYGIPVNKGIPILGSFWEIFFQRRSFSDVINDIYKTHKDAKYIVVYDTWVPTFVIRDVELIKSITVKHFDQFVNHRNFTSEKNDPLFTQNLFLLKDDRWKEVRNTVSPAFTGSKLRNMFGLMSDCAKKYGENMANLPGDQKELELKDTFNRYTNDVIATCAFGVAIDSMKDRDNEFYVYGRYVQNFSGLRLLKFFFLRNIPWLANLMKLRFVEPKMEKFFVDVITESIRNREENRVSRPDFIQSLLETNKEKLEPGKKMTVLDLTAHLFIFFLAGFDPVSTAMCFAAYEIGINEEIQRRLHEEIDEVLDKCNGEVTYEALMGMKYLDALVTETLRKYPLTPMTDRVCNQRFELPPTLPGAKPYVLEKGSYVQVPVYGIHRDERYYPNPEKFEPERFMGDGKRELNPATYLTFGLGPRMCIGNRFALLETKVLLFHVFAMCSLKPCAKTQIPIVFSTKTSNMMSKNGFWFNVQPRSSQTRM
ncbi:cytochrome P450 9e2-like [Ceratina calcarata]|uniref:Cytochrome P450 9e2-like n=1 Tax=Ceratina calcarata TaxID=156304 RepID=A0AAJ7J1U9_9HYME|nr:cytochrome P450 9e2-like [Ceratina calcarata]